MAMSDGNIVSDDCNLAGFLHRACAAAQVCQGLFTGDGMMACCAASAAPQLNIALLPACSRDRNSAKTTRPEYAALLLRCAGAAGADRRSQRSAQVGRQVPAKTAMQSHSVQRCNATSVHSLTWLLSVCSRTLLAGAPAPAPSPK